MHHQTSQPLSQSDPLKSQFNTLGYFKKNLFCNASREDNLVGISHYKRTHYLISGSRGKKLTNY